MVNIFVSTSNHLIWLDLLKLFLSSILLTLIFILSACVFYVCVFPLSSIFFLFLLLCLFCFLIHSKPVCACMRACICIWVDAISKIPWMSLNMNVWQLHWRKKNHKQSTWHFSSLNFINWSTLLPHEWRVDFFISSKTSLFPKSSSEY